MLEQISIITGFSFSIFNIIILIIGFMIALPIIFLFFKIVIWLISIGVTMFMSVIGTTIFIIVVYMFMSVLITKNEYSFYPFIKGAIYETENN